MVSPQQKRGRRTSATIRKNSSGDVSSAMVILTDATFVVRIGAKGKLIGDQRSIPNIAEIPIKTARVSVHAQTGWGFCIAMLIENSSAIKTIWARNRKKSSGQTLRPNVQRAPCSEGPHARGTVFKWS